ncbi:MAG: hypothetical protein BMS9Abin25_0810 [Gammaproteobacteria bacterium]|nr:MAG: hypothetical protein BMS9Abin25_0810 [Gammaproteobacteria bacterium]
MLLAKYLFRKRNIKILLILLVTTITFVVIFNGYSRPASKQIFADDQRLNKKFLLCKQCNLLLLNVELLRADYVGLLNPDTPSNTPNIDLFFKNSIQFSKASAPAGETYRSNLAILTAKEAFNFPVTEKKIHKFIQHNKKNHTTAEFMVVREMLLKYPTLAEHLKASNYHTISMNQGIRAGKHLLLDRGFDTAINWDRREVSYRQTIDSLLNSLKRNKSTPYMLLYRPEVLHPMPYFYPENLNRIEDKKRIIYRYRPRYSRYNIRANHSIPDSEIRQALHEIYAQQVRLVDNELGLIFKYLESSSQLSNTIVVLYANHGSGLGDNGVKKLAVSYQSSIHVPLLIRHPAVKHAIQINTPITLLDLMPTLMELTGNNVPDNIDGRSLLRDYSQPQEAQRPIIGRNDFDEYIRLGAYKLIRKQGNRLELYNLDNDPGELNNIAMQEPDRKRKMSGILDSVKLNILKNQ